MPSLKHLMEQLTPHPETKEMGIWLGRDALNDMITEIDSGGVATDLYAAQTLIENLRRQNEGLRVQLKEIKDDRQAEIKL